MGAAGHTSAPGASVSPPATGGRGGDYLWAFRVSLRVSAALTRMVPAPGVAPQGGAPLTSPSGAQDEGGLGPD